MEEVKYFQETERALREAVERLESAEERHEMLVRVNRQLGRRVGAFDDGVYMGIVRILSKLLVKNGTRKD